MLPITEPKIAGLTPRWAPFPGFSLLFDAPASAYQNGLLAADVERDPALEFYRRVHRAFGALNPDLLLTTYGLCPLTPASYHVTAYDVANVADLSRCHAAVRDDLRATLDRLPDPAAFAAPLLAIARAFAAPVQTFRYGELRISGRVMIVRLEPTDDAPYAEFVEARAALSRSLREAYGVGAGERYTPHLSIGYFANAQGAELAQSRRPAWDDALRTAVGDEPLAFPSASLHAFTDMATFFRKARG